MNCHIGAVWLELFTANKIKKVPKGVQKSNHQLLSKSTFFVCWFVLGTCLAVLRDYSWHSCTGVGWGSLYWVQEIELVSAKSKASALPAVLLAAVLSFQPLEKDLL